jgi:SsrA-binding protein
MTDAIKIVTSNRKATFEYHIEERFEAGIVLTGTEVKSLRAGKANLQEAYCIVERGEMILRGCHIAPYEHGNRANHEPGRSRKLLLHKREIEKIDKAARQKGYTIVPLKLYFKNGKAKIEIGLGKGKKLYDKRADIAERESNRRLDRLKVESRKGGE